MALDLQQWWWHALLLAALSLAMVIGVVLRPLHSSAAASVQNLHAADVTVNGVTFNTVNTSAPTGSGVNATAPMTKNSWTTFVEGSVSIFASGAVPAGEQWDLAGTWTFSPYVRNTVQNGVDADLRATVFKINTDGTTSALGTGTRTGILLNTSFGQYSWNLAVGATTLASGERFGVRFEVRDLDGRGGSAYLRLDDPAAVSTVTAQVTVTSVPGSPTDANATAGDAAATVTWSAPTSNGGSAITSYTVTSSPGGLTATTPDGATLQATVTGLTNGTEYTFTVVATNAIGNSAPSTPSNAVTPSPPGTVPDAPTNATATAGDTQATVTWSAPGSDGGSAITSYTVTSSPGGLTATTPDGSTLQATVTGLTNGTEYTFTVVATNAIGNSAPSTASNAVTPQTATVPDAPTNASASEGDTKSIVTWSAPASDGGSAITSYTVTSDPGGLTATTADGSTLTATVTGLTNGTTYTFTVVATNAVGNSAPSTASNAVTPETATVPDAPTGASATPGNTAATVTWTAPAFDGRSPITSYRVTSSPGGVSATTADGSTLQATVTGLTNGTEYTFTVVAINLVGDSAPSAPSNAVTPATAATVSDPPTGASATAGYQQATVTWSAPASNGGSAITSYTVTSDPGGLTATTADGSTLQATVTGLTNGTEYTFTVVATNAVGASAPSAPSNAVTPTETVPDPPTNVVATAANQQASITWAAPVSNGGGAIVSYTVTSSPGGLAATTPDGVTLSGTVSGLTNGVTYTFTVVATNATGNSTPSAPSNAVTPSAASWPDPPARTLPAHNLHEQYSADTAACAACHRVHTSPAPTVLYKAWPEENVCFTCHDGSAAPDIQTPFSRTYKMPITATTGVHSKDEPRLKSSANFTGANRHVECADCHNPHLAGAGNHTVGTNYTAGPQQGVWGLAVSNNTAWTAPTFTPITEVTMQYQLCFKCHSSWAYGGNPPQSPSGGFAQTDQAKEFNTLNASYHPVEDVGKNPFTRSDGSSYAGSLIGGFTPTSRMVCTDCHRSNVQTDAEGPHGSDQPFILRGQWDRTTGRTGTSSHLCFNCHAFSTYGAGATNNASLTGFSGGGDNLHSRMVGARNKAYGDAPIVCMDCHVAIVHGYTRDHLLGYTGDGAPYVNRPYSGGLVVIDQWRASGQWTFSSCDTAMNSCK